MCARTPREIPPPIPELTQKDFSDRGIWEQVLYEGIMDGLGFSKNRDPFMRLARSVTLRLIKSFKLEGDITALQSVLFGTANLLPRIRSLKDAASKAYVRSLVRSWNGFRKNLRIDRVHRAEWQFFPTRPANFPTIRIAAACLLIRKLLNEDLFRDIIQSVKSLDPVDARRAQLRKLLTITPNEFWRSHYNFDTPAGKVVTALGTSRIDDILCNAILPICLLYARIFHALSVREGAIQLLDSFPALSENSITRLMSRQLLQGKMRLEKMSLQQGVIQLYKYYCLERRCSECEVGKRVFSF